jgi:hypothetical protein
VLFRRLGLRAPTFVDSSDHFSSIDAEFDKGINFYGSYLAGHKEFDQRAAAAIGTISSDVGDESMLNYINWYLARNGRKNGRRPVAATAARPVPLPGALEMAG